MPHKLTLGRNLPTLTVAFCLWLALLVITGTIAGQTDYADTAWAALLYGAIDGVAAIAVTTVALLAWRYNRRSRFSIMVAFGAVAFAAGQLWQRSAPRWD